MSEFPETVQILLQRAVVEMRSEWSTLVELAVRLNPEALDGVAGGMSVHAKIGVDSIRRKLLSIQHAVTLGYSPEEITARGQEKTVSEFNQSKRESNYEKKVVMKWQVPGSLRERIQEQQARVMKILDLPHSEAFWDWWVGLLINSKDEEILASGGEHTPY